MIGFSLQYFRNIPKFSRNLKDFFCVSRETINCVCVFQERMFYVLRGPINFVLFLHYSALLRIPCYAFCLNSHIVHNIFLLLNSHSIFTLAVNSCRFCCQLGNTRINWILQLATRTTKISLYLQCCKTHPMEKTRGSQGSGFRDLSTQVFE